MTRYRNSNNFSNNIPRALWTIVIIALIMGGVYLFNKWNKVETFEPEPQDSELTVSLYNSSYGTSSEDSKDKKTSAKAKRNSSRNHRDSSLKDSKGNAIAPEKYLDVKMSSSIPSEMLEYTGMIMSFNPELHIPNWVAWELTDEETRGRLGRSENFMPDPDCASSAQLSDYRRSGYDRGHMCPAADAKWDEQFMQEVFYLTNMCPQDHEMNTGEWNNLEIKCRDWARTDGSIIIITGPVITDKLTKTIGRSKVAVPERFFKVILSPNATPPRAIGFIMANRNNPGSMQQNSYSVDEVERITGYDFFSIIDDQIEDKIESVNDFNTWSKVGRRY